MHGNFALCGKENLAVSAQRRSQSLSFFLPSAHKWQKPFLPSCFFPGFSFLSFSSFFPQLFLIYSFSHTILQSFFHYLTASNAAAMEETQSFRLIGSTDVEEITCYRVGEQNVVYWGDIDQVFPGVKHVKNGKVTASMMRDSHGVW